MALYTLDYSSIMDVANEYSVAHSKYSFSIFKVSDTVIHIRITNGQKIATLYVYLKQNGGVHFHKDGNPNLQSVCEGCKAFIIEKTSLPDTLKKTLTLKHCEYPKYEELLELLQSQGFQIVDVANNDANVKVRHQIDAPNNSHSHVTFYNNGTFLLQGNVTPGYVSVMVYAIEKFDGTKVSDVAESICLKNTVPVIDTSPSAYISDIHHIETVGDTLTRMIESSLILFNSGLKLSDYSCFTFGALRAVEGVLKLRMQTEIDMSEKSVGTFFVENNVTHKWNADGDARIFNEARFGNLCLALGDAYTVYNKRRNTIFHVDNQVIITKSLTYDEAWDITKEALEAINGICKNW